MEKLTKENASKVSTVINIQHPEFGSKRFRCNANGEGFSTIGIGCDGAYLFDHEFKFYMVNTWL